MSEWKKYKLGELIELIGGGTPKTSIAEYWNGDISWLSVADFNHEMKYVYNTEKKITQLGLNNNSAKLLEKGNIIISARGTVGIVAVLGKRMAFNQSCYGVKAIDKLTTNDYVYYLLKNSISNFIQVSHGGVFNTITKDTFNEIDILLPSLPEQKAIASVLSSLDEKIDLLHRQNAILEKMAETLFRQWFVEEAKEEWEEGKISDEFDFVMGASPPGESYNEDGVGISMYQGNADFGFRFPSQRVYTTNPKRFAEKHDTLVSVRAPVGEQNMANEKCCIGRGVAAFRYKKDNSFYTYTYYKMKSLMDEIKQFNETGTVFGSISKVDFESILAIIPDDSIISKFQKKIQLIDEKITYNCIQIRTLTTLRNTLLPKLMSGEVRVKIMQ
jgi:type I restriction enzyme S subunit